MRKIRLPFAKGRSQYALSPKTQAKSKSIEICEQRNDTKERATNIESIAIGSLPRRIGDFGHRRDTDDPLQSEICLVRGARIGADAEVP